MAGYTEQEITAAVSTFVKSGITVKRDVLGPIDVSAQFDETIQLLSSTLIFDPNAIFYLIYLISNKLNADVVSLVTTVNDLEEAIGELYKLTKEVTRVSLLADASSALLSVDTILTQNAAISNVSFDRYVAAIDAFRDVSLTPNIKQGTNIVRPPQEARTAALTDLTTISSEYPPVLELADRLMTVIDQFNTLNLPVLTAQESIRRTRKDLIDLQKNFADTTKTADAKIAMTRDAYLRITAGKAVLSNLTTVRNPTDPRMKSTATLIGRVGIGTLIPASISASVGPYTITTGVNDTLVIAEDGNSTTTYTLIPPAKASVRNYLPGPFSLVADSAASVTGTITGPFTIAVSPNNVFQLYVDSILRSATLTAGSRTATQICADINAGMGSYVLATVVSNTVKITHLQTGLHTLVIADTNPASSPVNTILGFTIGQNSKGTAANNVIEVDGHQIVFAPGSRTNSSLAAEFSLAGYVASVVGGFLVITKNAVGDQTITMTASTDTIKRTYDLLGFYSGQNDTSKTMSAAEVVDQINAVDKVDAVVVRTVVGGLVQESFKITSRKTDLTTVLDVRTANANATFGFSVAVNRGTTTGFLATESNKDTNFAEYDVVAGDLLIISGVSRTVTKVGTTQIEVTPPLSTNANTRYDFLIYSADALEYAAFVVDMSAWRATVTNSRFYKDTQELDRLMNPLLTNKNPSRGQVADAKAAADELLALLESLNSILVAFVIREAARVDSAVRMLLERGMDRAYDTLMEGKLTEFFAMTKDDAVRSAYMLKTARHVIQNDLPLSRMAEDGDDIIHDSANIVGTDANYDYSDRVKDENLRLLGEAPEMDADDPEASSQFWKERY